MGIQDTCDFQTSIMGRATLKDGVPTFWGTSGRTLQWLVTAVATTDFLLFGYDQGVMSGIISSEAFVTDFPEVHNDSTYEGFVVSIYAVGCFLGALFILNFGDWLGRRRSIYIGAVVMVIGVIIQLAAVPVGGGATAQFIVGRAITGVGNDFFLSYLALFVVILFYVIGLVWKRQTWLRTANIDVDPGRREIDWEAYEQLKMEKQNWPAWKRVYHFLF